MLMMAGLVGFGSTGCKGPCGTSSDPTLELGLGLTEFQPIEADTVATLVYGSQGGQHLDLAIRATGFDGDTTLTSSIEGRRAGTDVVVAEGTPWLGLECQEEGQIATGLRLIAIAAPFTLADAPLDIAITVTDARGVSATATATVDVLDPGE